MVRDLPFERYVSDKDMLDFTLRQRYPPIFRISDMLSAKRKNSEELMGEKTKNSRWMIEDPKKRKSSLGGWVAGKSGGDYDKMFGSNFDSNQAAYLDAYGQMAYDVLPDIHTDELRPMVREGWKPPTSMEYLTDLLVDGPFDDGWDKPRQYFPASNIPLKNLPPRLRTMMDGLKERNFGFAPQFILDNAEDEYGRVGTRNAEKEYRKQGGARDQFIRRSAIEAAILLNVLDRERKSANKEVVQNLVESGLYDEEHPSMRAFDPSWGYMQPEVLYGTEEDEPAIMNEAFSENWQLFNRSEDSHFDSAWAIVKMPFVVEDGNLQTDILYQGRRTGDKDTGYWTPHKSKALAYAMFGPRYDYEGSPFVDANVHYPELYAARAPRGEYIEVPGDDEYMGSGTVAAVGRGRVAFHDPKGIVEPYSRKAPDEHVAQIIQNIIDSDLYDEEMDEFEEEHYDEDDEQGFDAWQKIFLQPNDGDHYSWESIYPNTRMYDEPESTALYEALEEFYSESPVWDKITTNDMLVGGSTPHDFVRRLRERGQ